MFDSGLLQIGSQCALPTCNEVDFLPILCQCSQKFCKSHISPTSHACPQIKAVHTDLGSTTTEKFQRCNIQKCNKITLGAYNSDTSVTCTQCQKSFCADHRYPESHDCVTNEVVRLPSKTEVARVLLAKNFPTTPTTSKNAPVSRRTKIPTDPAKLEQFKKVQLMKMRHRATAGDPKDISASLPVEDRLFVKVMTDQNMENVFWFRKSQKTIGTGRALDLLVTQLKLSTSLPLQLLQLPLGGSEGVVLRNDLLLTDQVEEGSILQIRTTV